MLYHSEFFDFCVYLLVLGWFYRELLEFFWASDLCCCFLNILNVQLLSVVDLAVCCIDDWLPLANGPHFSSERLNTETDTWCSRVGPVLKWLGISTVALLFAHYLLNHLQEIESQYLDKRISNSCWLWVHFILRTSHRISQDIPYCTSPLEETPSPPPPDPLQTRTILIVTQLLYIIRFKICTSQVYR